MVVLERYLQLYERESQLISSAWKTFHIFFYVVIALSGLAASYAFRWALESFGGHCFLYGNVTVISERRENSLTPSLTIDFVNSEWGRESDCSFCQYVPLCSVIFSAVWITFFLMCGRGGKTTHGLSQPWRIVLPSLIFNITFFGVALAAACKLHDGISVFCSLFQDDMDETNCYGLVRHKMMDGNTGLQTYICMKVAKISSWINMAGWSMSVVVLLVRCFYAPDFQLMQVSKLAPTPVKEQRLSCSQDSTDGVCEEMIDHGNTGPKYESCA